MHGSDENTDAKTKIDYYLYMAGCTVHHALWGSYDAHNFVVHLDKNFTIFQKYVQGERLIDRITMIYCMDKPS